MWSWWRHGSIHRSAWPESATLRAASGAADALPLHVAADVLSEVRRAKSEAKRSMRTPVTHVAVTDTAERLAALEPVAGDLREAGVIADLVTHAGDALHVEVRLAPEDSAP